MTHPQIRSKFRGDFLVPSFYGNIESVPRKGPCKKLFRASTKENSDYSVSSIEVNNSRRCNNQGNKEKPALRSSLKDKNIGDNGRVFSNCLQNVSNSKIYDRSSRSSRTTHYHDTEEQMETARNTSEWNMGNLREKCASLNFEFSQVQERHGDYLANQISRVSDENDANYSDSSDIALERKYTEVFQKSSRPSSPIFKKDLDTGKRTTERKTKPSDIDHSNNKDLKLILKTIKQVFKTPPVVSSDTNEMTKLYEIVKTLQDEHDKFRNVISSQQDQLNSIQSKYLKAENIIKSQKYEIQKLNRTNTLLENELNSNIDALKVKLQEKTNEAAQLPQAIKGEKIKAEKLSKQNCELISRLQEVKNELALTRAKLVDAAQRRSTTLNKLKASEKDLKIFRNQNNILKTEKRTLIEELKRLKHFNEEVTIRTSKNISRQRERGESQQRLLQKKILDLELELTRSRNSTGDLIEERDKLIAELHQQLNTLVHNFEVSQKHIRVLRKHIHSISGTATISQKVQE